MCRYKIDFVYYKTIISQGEPDYRTIYLTTSTTIKTKHHFSWHSGGIADKASWGGRSRGVTTMTRTANGQNSKKDQRMR